MIQYDPKDATNALPKDKYQGCIASVSEATSKSSGRPMWVIGFTAYAPSGSEHTIKEYIVVPDALWKLKKLARALNKGAEFEAGRFDPTQHLNANVILLLDVEESEQYGDKNVITGFESYVGSAPRTPTAKPTQKAATSSYEEIKPDDIPF